MKNTIHDQNLAVSQDRKNLENPYAHLNDQGGFSALILPSMIKNNSQDTNQAISDDRKRLENPYSHLDAQGGYSALIVSRRKKVSLPILSETSIKKRVQKIHRQLWNQRNENPSAIPPIKLLNPEIALLREGFSVKREMSLGQYSFEGRLVEAAGALDEEDASVSISLQFPPDVQRFTLAHELGHVVLHKGHGLNLHRDRPANGSYLARDQVEKEADIFAKLFLLPEKLLRNYFEAFFGETHLEANEQTAFLLAGASLQDFYARYRSRRSFSRLVASCERYGNHRFVSLAKTFEISVEAMAIRLEELGLA